VAGRRDNEDVVEGLTFTKDEVRPTMVLDRFPVSVMGTVIDLADNSGILDTSERDWGDILDELTSLYRSDGAVVALIVRSCPESDGIESSGSEPKEEQSSRSASI